MWLGVNGQELWPYGTMRQLHSISFSSSFRPFNKKNAQSTMAQLTLEKNYSSRT
jgi:hypothetical protein